MKKILKSVFALAIIGLVLSSCENDSDSQKLSKNSTLTQLLMRVTHNGNTPTGKSEDDDDMPCFVVDLPVSLVVDGQTVTITTMDEYATVQNALHHAGDSDDDDDDDDDSDDDEVHATFVFPISITFADGTTQLIATEEELDVAVHSCGDDADDIECLDLHYPLTLTFTDANNVSTVVTLNNDDETYTFLATLGGSETVVINYPLTITDANGETEVVNSNEELTDEIQQADDDCGNDDGDDDQGEDDKR
ncbi:hypothetical protein [Flavobacterium terrisoli]|uniref:hypothetical protein n=1 Tax=Flavobacterium terrisoli TaxID=3242195 RepID=UPI00254383D2|nr:hypothetical protein [Flavobacterium buctense]